ncbi:TIGR03086 family metal-binding protein [Streptomyces sp. NPDC002701]|uniref:TIGR03086 family metal-binding protein n=1 Tax=Streptomyces sp. NPDC002701 TaxID=3364661 RepID=UPI00368628E8
MIDLRPACRRMTDVLAGIRDDQLDGPTPCAEYTVRDLMDHVGMVAQGFASLARKEGNEPADTSRSGGTQRDDVRRKDAAHHVSELSDAWQDPAAWQGCTSTGGLELPNELWGKIAFTEMVVHGWDLAKATRQPFALPEETLRACLDHVAEFVPNAPVPQLWGTAVEVDAAAPLLDRVLAITGRTP